MNLADLFNEIVRFEIELWNLVEARLICDHQIPLSWYEPMQAISVRENCRVQEISDALSITVGGVSKLVDRIQTAGFCKRCPDPLDKRSAIIVLTPSGARKLKAATKTFKQEIEASMGKALTKERLGEFLATIKTLRGEINRRKSLLVRT